MCAVLQCAFRAANVCGSQAAVAGVGLAFGTNCNNSLTCRKQRL